VRFQLLDASGAAIPSALAKGIDAGCRATLATSSGGAAAVERGCARLTGDHFQLNLATKDLPLGATVLTIVVRAEDGTVAARQSVTVTLR